MTLRRDLFEANRLSWDEATRAHEGHKAGQAALLRGGGSTLFPEDIELLGDARGRNLLHLQRGGGQDTLSLARLGAPVLGVDISEFAIDRARRVSAGSGTDAEFVRSEVREYLWSNGGRFRPDMPPMFGIVAQR